MAKQWEEVRAEICRLYAEGKPLEEVMRILKREQGFEAS